MPAISRSSVLIVLGVCLTTALPILAAITLARNQAAESENRYALSLARTAIARSEDTSDQIRAATRAIRALPPGAACGAEGLALMRKIALGSTMLQGVGQVEGNTIRCSSFGGDREFAMPAPYFRSSMGSLIRPEVRLLDPDRPYLAIQNGSAIAIIDRKLALSFVEDAPGLRVSLFSWSQRMPIVERGDVPNQLYGRDFEGRSVFTDALGTVAVVHSRRFDTGALVILPGSFMGDFGGKTALVLIPLGALVGLILSYVLVHVVRTRASLPAMIRSALRRRSFTLAYQPVIELKSGRTVGVEALLRWNSASGAPIPPDVFIPAAERAGMIAMITAEVLALLRDDVTEILPQAPEGFHFAVNVSAEDMHAGTLLEDLRRTLVERSGLPFSGLVVETTERSLMDIERAGATLRDLREVGVKTAIDDFGTGYSNLANLAQLDVDFLKIDKLFVQALGTASATNQVASRIIDMAKDLGLGIVAEGVETPRQAQLLTDLGVELAQGYLFGRPMPASELVERLKHEGGSRLIGTARRAA